MNATARRLHDGVAHRSDFIVYGQDLPRIPG
jgi:hypothetical protein